MTSIKNENAVKYCEPVVWNDNDVKLSPVLIDNEPHFVAVEVCKLLDLTNPSDRLKSLDEDEKLTYVMDRAGQKRTVNLVNESGFYHLIFISRKPEAAAIRKWVTAEVLPTLRRTGHYEVAPARSRESVRYPRRGEPINAEVLHLLWLIGESLNPGDQTRIALELGVSRQTVARVLAGRQRSARVLAALYSCARAAREQNALYHNPGVMARRLLGEDSSETPPQLPPVKFKGRGGALGNQNARKMKH